MRASTTRSLTTTLETLFCLRPDTEVHLRFRAGQNNADSASRQSTRNSEETRDQFKECVTRKTEEILAEMAVFPQVTTHWVEPFDDPEADFTPLYLTLTGDLKEIVMKQNHVLQFGPFLSFESDHYHLTTSERHRFARQIVDWFTTGP